MAFCTLHSHLRHHGWDPQVFDLDQSDDPNWFKHANDPPLLNPDIDAHGDYCCCIAQSATSLPDDEETPTNIKDYTLPTWASLTEDTLDTIVESCVLQANLHCLVHTGS
jgi:hypothetical protein